MFQFAAFALPTLYIQVVRIKYCYLGFPPFIRLQLSEIEVKISVEGKLLGHSPDLAYCLRMRDSVGVMNPQLFALASRYISAKRGARPKNLVLWNILVCSQLKPATCVRLVALSRWEYASPEIKQPGCIQSTMQG